MSRRRSELGSSLDLFLDTICNAFGGIMFIAILVSVVLQTRKASIQRPDTNANRSVPSTEYRGMEEEKKQLNKLLAKFHDEETSVRSGPLRELYDTWETQASRLDALATQNEKTLQEITSLLAMIAQRQADLESLKNRLKDARQAVAERDAQIEKEMEGRVKFLQLPIVKDTNKRNILLLMRFGRIYQVQEFDSAALPIGMNKNHVQVMPDGSSVRPKEKGGWKFSNASDRIELQSLLRSQRASEVMVTVGVWNDSFDAFAELKKILIDSGFDYELFPISDVDAVSLGNASQKPKVQ